MWEVTKPMASYVTTLQIGQFDIKRSQVAGDLPILNAVDERINTPELQRRLAKLPEIINFFSKKFGPYPFDAAGSIVDRAPAGYAMEQQTRPVFPSADSIDALAHEYGRQWFGDAVAVHRFRDVWLSEGFATYSGWLWDQHTGGPTTKERFDRLYATPAGDSFWDETVYDPGAEDQYAGRVYSRGAMTLQALRGRVGDEVFFAILQRFVSTYEHGTASTGDLSPGGRRLRRES